jgi:hypothetical protein
MFQTLVCLSYVASDDVTSVVHLTLKGGQTSTGSVVNWYKTLCGGGEGFYDEVNAAAELVPPGRGVIQNKQSTDIELRTST